MRGYVRCWLNRRLSMIDLQKSEFQHFSLCHGKRRWLTSWEKVGPLFLCHHFVRFRYFSPQDSWIFTCDIINYAYSLCTDVKFVVDLFIFVRFFCNSWFWHLTFVSILRARFYFSWQWLLKNSLACCPNTVVDSTNKELFPVILVHLFACNWCFWYLHEFSEQDFTSYK